jgi:hypothetical protein
MAARKRVKKNIPNEGVNLKEVLQSKKIPASRLHPINGQSLGVEDILPHSVKASKKLQQKMGISPLPAQEFQRAINEGLVDWKVIYARGKEENIRLVAYSLWENGHGDETENWVQAENLINPIWDKIESHVNTESELNNYLKEHQAQIRILL